MTKEINLSPVIEKLRKGVCRRVTEGRPAVVVDIEETEHFMRSVADILSALTPPAEPVSRPAGEGEREAVARIIDDAPDHQTADELADAIIALLRPDAPDAGGGALGPLGEESDSALKIATDLHAAYEQLIYGLPKYLDAENLTDEENMIRDLRIQHPDIRQIENERGDLWLPGGSTPQSAGCVVDIHSIAQSVEQQVLATLRPGHTDLMVTPESIDAFLGENPPPAAPVSPDSDLLKEAVGLLAESIDLMTDDYQDCAAHRAKARAFLSKVEERG